MEILFEVLLQLGWWLLQFFGEALLQAVGELIGRSVAEPFRREKPINPWLAAIGYLIFGAAAGGLSLLFIPTLLISNTDLRMVNIILTPLLMGLLMSQLGQWRRKHDMTTIRLDTFLYGFLFALSMAAVRLAFGQ
jgi:hypothetical protein